MIGLQTGLTESSVSNPDPPGVVARALLDASDSDAADRHGRGIPGASVGSAVVDEKGHAAVERLAADAERSGGRTGRARAAARRLARRLRDERRAPARAVTRDEADGPGRGAGDRGPGAPGCRAGDRGAARLPEPRRSSPAGSARRWPRSSRTAATTAGARRIRGRRSRWSSSPPTRPARSRSHRRETPRTATRSRGSSTSPATRSRASTT